MIAIHYQTQLYDFLNIVRWSIVTCNILLFSKSIYCQDLSNLFTGEKNEEFTKWHNDFRGKKIIPEVSMFPIFPVS